MKKVIVSILMILYLGSFSGIAMDIHYCMGKKSGVDFFDGNNKKCGKCGMKEKKGCCSDHHKFYKLSDSHRSASNSISFGTFEIPLITDFALYDWRITESSVSRVIRNNSPPGLSQPSLIVLNCVFRL